ncbi:MAG TPA: 16S rRNA (adenine(1518)-N(6)/adenine(1519)-N(6))-dimethyltransferase RsmA [Myxococcota bacterium]
MHPKQQLEGTGIAPKHSFGQNFLADEFHQQRIADLAVLCARPAKGEAPLVVELGPGLGALTGRLLERKAKVIAVERDRDLVPLLGKRFTAETASNDLTIVEDNAITWPLTPENGVKDGFALVGNLPYHHAADLCLRCVDSLPRIGGGCFLIQLEVAERIAAPPGGKDYGILSVLLQSRFKIDMPHVVPAGAFWPVPEVDGGVITLRPLPAEDVADDVSFEALRLVVRAAFSQRRKTLRNVLGPLAAERHVDLDAAFAAADIEATARAEQIDVARFVRLTRALTPPPKPAAKKKTTKKTAAQTAPATTTLTTKKSTTIEKPIKTMKARRLAEKAAKAAAAAAGDTDARG